MEGGVKGSIHSDIGFYVGDICYVLSEEHYHGFWGKRNEYKDGVYKIDEKGLGFAVAGTAYGDGNYSDKRCNIYGVDAGVIGLVPLELVKEDADLELGMVFKGEGEAVIEADGGVFDITLPGDKQIMIDTGFDED